MIILCNKGETPFPFIVSGLLMDKLLGLPHIDWTQKYKLIAELNADEPKYEKPLEIIPSHPISDYLGTYSNPGYGTIEVRLSGEKLVVLHNNLHIPLEPYNYDVFEVSRESSIFGIEGLKFSFQSNNHGDIQTLSIPWDERLPGIVFTKEDDPSLSNPIYLSQFVGNYSYLGFTIQIEEQENKLIAKAFGQPPFELYPNKSHSFRVHNHDGYLIDFLVDEFSEIYAVQLTQPNNTTYTARKIN